MNRRNGVTSISVASTLNQENNVTRNKNVDGPAAARPAARPTLADVTNQGNAGALKRTGAFVARKAEENTSFPMKVEPRRPLRSVAASNVSLPTAKNVDQKPAGANKTSVVPQNRTTSNTSSLLTSHSTLVTTADANATKSKFAISQTSKLSAAAVIGTRQLTRAQASSNLLQQSKVSIASTLESVDTSKGQVTKLATTAEVEALHAALVLSPVKGNDERSEVTENAYSSSMMPNVDKEDKGNTQLIPEYVNDIYDYLRALEQQQCIRENFLDGREVSGRMRSILVDWLSQVHIRFRLMSETLYMTVALVDRFLQVHYVPKDKLQLVGISAMFIASKYEEMYSPEIGDFVYITDRSCTKQDIRAMECLILRSLGFSIGRPLPIHFLRRYSKVADADPTKHTLAKYFLELALVQYPLSHFPPSMIAAAALWLSFKLMDPEFEWSPTLVHYSKYRESDFAVCLRRLCRTVVKTHNGEIKQQAIRNKFATENYMRISKDPCLDMTRIAEYGK